MGDNIISIKNCINIILSTNIECITTVNTRILRNLGKLLMFCFKRNLAQYKHLIIS